MTADDAIRDFATAATELPRAAMQWALDHWDEAGPRFVALVATYASGDDSSEQTERALFIVLHLLAERRETAAFRPLCAILADAETADLVLGEALTETLCGILISLFDGDVTILQRLVETERADEFAREGALLVLAYLTRAGRWPTEAMRSYLRHLRHELQPQDTHIVWLGWVLAVAHLGYADMTGEVQAVMQAGLVPQNVMVFNHFQQDLRRTLADPARMAGFEQGNVIPFTNAIGELSAWYESDVPEAPIINPLRGIGRNDPCPCGSGKKYKKCCLPA